MKFSRNQQVLILDSDGEQEGEIGIVVRVGFTIRHDDDDDEVNDHRDPNESGVEIRFPVSGRRRVVDSTYLRLVENTEENETSVDSKHPSSRQRRSTRNLPEPVKSEFPSTLVTPEPVVAPRIESKQKKNVPISKTADNAIPSQATDGKSRKKSQITVEKEHRMTSSPYFANDDESDGVLPTIAASKKKSVKRKLSTPKVENTSDYCTPDDPSSKTSSTSTISKKVKLSNGTKTNDSKTKKEAPLLLIERNATGSEQEPNDDDDNTENNDDDSFIDREFTIDCATSGRATCRTCDEIIKRDMLRVSHVPLFRGKPGYRIYRHLHCSVFSENVNNPQDIKGWRKLKKSDLQLLEAQIKKSKEIVEQENEEIQPDELVQGEFQGEIRGPPKGLAGASLLPFQVEGASWMYHQEYHVDNIRGGILADEMGMGKTLQTIVTILDNRPLLQHTKPGMKHPPGASDISARNREEALWATSLAEWKNEMEMNNISKSLVSRKSAPRAGTLVICPLIALSQWKTEIEKFSDQGSLTVCIYHGPDRASKTPVQTLAKYDVILTTFQVLEQDFRKMVSPNKVRCPNCNAKFKIDKLRVHLKYFCGEGAQRTEAQSRQRRGGGRQDASAPTTGVDGKGKAKNTKSKVSDTMKSFTMEKKKTIKVKKMKGFDSDSDLSVNEESFSNATSCRPCRTAATAASKKVKASAKQWKDTADSESSYASDENDEDNSDSDSEAPVKKGIVAKKVAPKASKNDAIQRAIEKQQEAMQNAKKEKNKPMKNGKKQQESMQKAKQMIKTPTKGGKKSFDNKSSSEEDEDPSDPLAGIDLDELMEEAMAGSVQSPLHAITWWRVVLDEAHFIKSRSSQTAAAAFALTSIHRWCLSGTPLQNRVGELYSLIRFLRLDPMALYFCKQKGCTCKSLHYRMQHGRCQGCGHHSFSHFSHFNKHVLTPIQRDGYSGDGRRAMFKLKTDILDMCLLRRTKETRAADMELPPRLVTIRYVRQHPVEADFYQSLYTETKASFDDYVQAGTLMNNYAHIFDLLTKMRQATSHPYMVVHTKNGKNKFNGKSEVANGSVLCDICHESPTDRVLSGCCGAAFCRSCVMEYMSASGGGGTPCPSCNSPFTVDLGQATVEDTVDDGVLIVPTHGKAGKLSPDMPSLKEMQHVATGSILRRINLAEFATSTKIEVLLQELIQMRKKRPGCKALVFSQFVNMLDLVRWRIHSDPCMADLGLGVQILHGGMPVAARDETLKVFREDTNCRVLLMSLKAAGVALNLTVASECYLLDLWWNPAAEMQAIDRTHRLGQYRPIRAVRFVAEGTVEERILQLQEKKRLLFDGTVGRDAGSLKMLTVDDMAALFM